MTLCRHCGTEIAPGEGDDRKRDPGHFNHFTCIERLRGRVARLEFQSESLPPPGDVVEVVLLAAHDRNAARWHDDAGDAIWGARGWRPAALGESAP